MAVEKSYARLGLFLVLVLVVVLATALFFIYRLRSRAVFPAVTYTTENVSGLDVSSPVRYRGVSVGRITDVRVDPNTGSIEIDFELFLDRLTKVGVNFKETREKVDIGLLEKLRAQVVTNPVTGDAYLLLDRPQNAPPPPPLSFKPDRTYVPSMPTMFSKVQDRLPEVLDRAEAMLQTLREIVIKVPDSLDRSDRFFANVERIFQESRLPELSADSRKFLTATSAQLAQIEQVTAELNRLIKSEEKFTKVVEDTRSAIEDTRATIKAAELPATAQSARDMADRTSVAADELRRSLPAIRDSLEQLRQLARLLEEQPESVVYGPRPSESKSK